MRIAASVVFAVGVAWCVEPAIAGPSDDLVFCSRLKDKAERIACFDAAARLAARPPSTKDRAVRSESAAVRVEHVPVGRAFAAGSTLPPDIVGTFDGSYLGVGGSYGVGTTRRVSAFTSFASGGLFEESYPAGPSANVFGGYNLTFGPFVFGTEVSGRWGREALSAGGIFNVNSFTTPGPTGQTEIKYRFDNDASAHLSLRAGMLVRDVMVFAKAGFGFAHILETGEAIGSGEICTAARFTGVTLECTSRLPVGSATSTTETVLPSVLLGFGTEYNFGHWFARFGVEAEGIAGLQEGPRGFQVALVPGPGTFGASTFSQDFFWTVRANAGLGLRF